jgi:hypothetical protein
MKLRLIFGVAGGLLGFLLGMWSGIVGGIFVGVAGVLVFSGIGFHGAVSYPRPNKSFSISSL